MSISQRQARQQIDGLIQKYQRVAKPDRQAITEAGVVHQFLDPLFAALGWPVDDLQRYKYELHPPAVSPTPGPSLPRYGRR